MFIRNESRADALRRLGLWALVLCTASLAAENTLLLSMAATFRPSAFFAVAAAAVRLGCAITVPLWLILMVGVAGWSVTGRRAAVVEERHE